VKFTLVFTEPTTGVVMLRSPVEAATPEAAIRQGRAIQKTRASIAHWGLSVVHEAKPAPQLGPRPARLF